MTLVEQQELSDLMMMLIKIVELVFDKWEGTIKPFPGFTIRPQFSRACALDPFLYSTVQEEWIWQVLSCFAVLGRRGSLGR